MKKLKLEKLKNKHKFYSLFNGLTRALVYLPGCILFGLLSGMVVDGLFGRIIIALCWCLPYDSITRLIWKKAKKKAVAIEQEIEEYAETEQGEKEVVLLANIESIQEIIKDKDCKIKAPCERLLKKLLETKYKMANPPRVKAKDEDTGEVFYGEVVDDKIDLDEMLYKYAEE